MPCKLNDQLERVLNQRKELGSYRSLTPINHQSPLMIDFASNDYLSLSRTTGLTSLKGSTGSRLLTGHHPIMTEVEERIASYLKAEAGLIFNSGYDANLGLFSSLIQAGDTLIYDEYIHASIRDGAKLGGCRRFNFRHNDLDHLEKRLKSLSNVGHHLFVAVESVYSMDGDLCPLTPLVQLCEAYGAYVIVDEAHATGVFGPEGEGLVVAEQLEKRVFARIHTFGKALGTHGAIIVGSQLLKHFLINFARSLIYTTALPPQQFKVINEAFELMMHQPQLRDKLQQNIQFFVKKLNMNRDNVKFLSPIIPIVFEKRELLMTISERLKRAGFMVTPVLSPTVPRSKERLRISLHAHNTFNEIEEFFSHYSQFIQEAL